MSEENIIITIYSVSNKVDNQEVNTVFLAVNEYKKHVSLSTRNNSKH